MECVKLTGFFTEAGGVISSCNCPIVRTCSTRLNIAAALLFLACITSTGARSEEKDPLGTLAPYVLPIPSAGPFILPRNVPSVDPAPQIYVMNAQRYRIPRNYIVTLSKEKDGTAGAISMRAVLPGLDALTSKTLPCLDGRNSCSDEIMTIGLLAQEHSVPGSRQLANIQVRVLPEKYVNSCGLEFYETRGNQSQRIQYFFKRLSSDLDVSILRCSKEGTSLAPMCSADFDIGDGNHVYYVFHRKFTCEWESIKTKISDRISSFKAEQ